MTKYYEQNCANQSFEIYLKNEYELGKSIKEIGEKTIQENHKGYPFQGKNYVLKSEICKEILHPINSVSKKKYANKCNPMLNYFFNECSNHQTKTDDNPKDIQKQEEKIEQSPEVKESQNNQKNIAYNNFIYMQETKNENPNNNNLNYDYNSQSVISQINNYVSNNIMKINNYYISENDMNISSQNSNFQRINPILFLIKDKFGCIMMKNKILSDPNYANEILFHQIKNDLRDLCCDNFSNYFLQSFLDIINFDNLNSFLNSINNNLAEICISPHGTRVIQKIIDKISYTPILLNKFAFILNSKDFHIICNSQYGNHVVQKFLSTIHSSEYTNFIYNNICNNFLEFANNKHGVFIVQKCISEGNEIQRKIIYQYIVDNFFALIENEFGNYLIQFILLDKKNIEQKFHEILPIILKIEENIVSLCFSQYSANAIEKCFEQSENIVRNHILDFLFFNHSNRIIDIMFNKYGIYIILKAIKSQNGKYKSTLLNIISKSDNELKYIMNSNANNSKNILKIIHKYKELDDVYNLIVTS